MLRPDAKRVHSSGTPCGCQGRGLWYQDSLLDNIPIKISNDPLIHRLRCSNIFRVIIESEGNQSTVHKQELRNENEQVYNLRKEKHLWQI